MIATGLKEQGEDMFDYLLRYEICNHKLSKCAKYGWMRSIVSNIIYRKTIKKVKKYRTFLIQEYYDDKLKIQSN